MKYINFYRTFNTFRTYSLASSSTHLFKFRFTATHLTTSLIFLFIRTQHTAQSPPILDLSDLHIHKKHQHISHSSLLYLFPT